MTFIETPKNVRMKKLENKYHFVCECTACSQDYPLFRDLEKALPDKVCSEVSTSFQKIDELFSNGKALHGIDEIKSLFSRLTSLPYLQAATQRLRIMLGTGHRMAYSV